MNRYSLIFLTFIIFVALFLIGSMRATRSPLWGDELLTVGSSTDQSYKDILLGQVDGAVNNPPLYYLLLKTFCDDLTNTYREGDLDKQTVEFRRWRLRLLSIIVMSLTVSGLFYFFARNFSLTWGFYSLLVSLTREPVLIFWTEVRYYTLWLALSALQAVLVITLLQMGYKKTTFRALIFTHAALILTHYFSIIQIVGLSLILWIFTLKDLKKFLSLTLIPSLLFLFYILQRVNISLSKLFVFPVPIYKLIMAHFNKEVFIITALAAVAMLYAKKNMPSNPKLQSLLKQGFAFLMPTITILIITLLFLFYLHGWPAAKAGNPMQYRYIAFLTPFGIIAMTYFTYFLFKLFENNRYVRWGLGIVIGLLLFQRAWMNFKVFLQ